MDPVTAGLLIAVGIAFLWGCSSDDNSDDGHSNVDGDAGDGDIHIDGADADGDVDGGDSDADAGDTPDCSTPRASFNDNWATTVFAYVPCDHKSLGIIDGKVSGVCDFPVNRVFACQIHSDPMESTTCTTVFTLDSMGDLPDGTRGENYPRQLKDLGDGRLALLYNTVGDSFATNVSVLSSSTYEGMQDFALPVSMRIGSGSDAITILTYSAQAMSFSQGNLFIATQNFDDLDMMFRRGTLLGVQPEGPSDNSFNPGDIGAYFTNGRNPASMAMIDDHTIAVLNAHGNDAEIPPEASAAALAAACTDELRLRNECEIAGASIDIIDVTDSTDPIMERTISIADVKLQALPELAITEDKSTAVVGSASVPPTIYSVTLGDPSTVRQVPLPATATGSISSIALAEGTPSLVLVSLTSGQLYEINLSAMSVIGEGIQLALEAGPSVFNADGAVLYQGVTGPYCGPADESRIIAVDPYR